jgi:2,4-dichlorophenol 6-monooxygenase
VNEGYGLRPRQVSSAGAESGGFDADVLVVGSGLAGASAALFLARHGVDVAVVTESSWVADSPRAHITNQRTMEVMRAVGLEAACALQATPGELIANQVMMTSLAGEEFGRLHTWGNDPARRGEYEASSPCTMCDLPQHLFEPLLVGEAARLGARFQFRSRFINLEQDDATVSAQVVDLVTGREEVIRARYLVGADGGQSAVAATVGLPLRGKARLSNAMNVRFTADLRQYFAHRPGTLYWVLQPDREDGMGDTKLRMVRPWHDWVAQFSHLGERAASLTREQALWEIRQIIQDDTIPVTVTGISPWRINQVVADRYSSGRVFCAGDSVHRHPPMNGLGGNTCIQDSFNLAWKLAYVLKGLAGPGLLDSYSIERQPIGRQVVDRAIATWRQSSDLLEVLGLDSSATPEERRHQLDVLSAPTDEGEKRRAAFAEACAAREYAYQAHGVEMNQIYESEAVITDNVGSFAFERDPELYHQQTSHPGARLPHCWVGVQGKTVSTLDLASPERFTLLTRIRGSDWIAAADTVAKELDVDLLALRIGQGADVADLYGDFARMSEIGESGCLLIRPDQHVAWRCETVTGDCVRELRRALARVLDRR